MKTMKRKLTLNRETVRNLTQREMLKVAGGFSLPSCPIACGPTEVASCTSCVCTNGGNCD
jgi:hypothetical protein